MARLRLAGARQVSLCTLDSSAEVPGLPDSLSVRWRIFAGVVCVCSFYAPHAGIAEAERVQFWQELVVMARRVHIEVRLPMIVAGDANVWHPHFNLGRSRSADNMIVGPLKPSRQGHPQRRCGP